jgi:hypothetical protein
MTHPDILKIQNTGYTTPEPPVVAHCIECGNEIYSGEEVYTPPDGSEGYICVNCDVDYMRRYKTVAS